MTDHVPPQNLDAEESVLGAMMMPAKHTIANVAEVVRPEDFYRESHGRIFRTAVELDARGEPVDAVTLAGELEARGWLADVGGKARIAELASLAPATANAARYAHLVREAAQRRQLIAAGKAIADLGMSGIGTTGELLDQAERQMAEATQSALSGDFTTITEGDDLIAQLENAVETGKPIHGLATGFHDFDRSTTGLYPGTLIILAARPKVGKSLLAQNLGENLARRNKPVGMFTLEMSKRELRLRSLVRNTRIDLQRLRTGRLNRTELESVKEQDAELSKLPFYVEDNPAITMTELRSRARRLKAKHGLELLIVDYLQLMVTDGRSQDSRERQVAELTRNLKLLAKELEIPVLVLSQLNRKLESREDKRPMLSDLRESGAIEQDADMVTFLYRESLYKDVVAEDAGTAEWIIAANRMGPQATVNLQFVGRFQTFNNPARAADQAQEEAA